MDTQSTLENDDGQKFFHMLNVQNVLSRYVVTYSDDAIESIRPSLDGEVDFDRLLADFEVITQEFYNSNQAYIASEEELTRWRAALVPFDTLTCDLSVRLIDTGHWPASMRDIADDEVETQQDYAVASANVADGVALAVATCQRQAELISTVKSLLEGFSASSVDVSVAAEQALALINDHQAAERDAKAGDASMAAGDALIQKISGHRANFLMAEIERLKARIPTPRKHVGATDAAKCEYVIAEPVAQL